MSGHLRLIFAPFMPLQYLEVLAVLAVLLVIFAFLRGARGATGRALVFALLLLALADPSLVKEQREPLKDMALLVIDESASMRLGDRVQQTAKAADRIATKLAGFSDIETGILHVKGADETNLFRAIESKLASLPRDRMAGIILMSDGEVHDQPTGPQPLPAPVHTLLAGHQKEIDRRLAVKEIPAYGIVGKTISLILRIDDHPQAQGETASVTFRRDDGTSGAFTMPVGKDMKFDVPVTHAGRNLFVFSTAAFPDELTAINNSAAVTINGIRDRLRVLLISGEPHIGGRTWRNFLKADPAVDLIHFTILRSPAKMDNIPNSELSLIAFPVHELFDIKLKSFDLVIFDRFRQQSLVPDSYLENIAQYVEHGGALLISNATDEDIPALTFSPLARILPTEPMGHLLTGSFVPELSPAGNRHPVTSQLAQDRPRSGWGSWLRQTEARAKKGEVLMTGLNNTPLLVLDRVGEGRVAQFLSDQFWLWSRGYGGGGPQADLLKRTAHWLVGEPELDETALRVEAEPSNDGWQLNISKQSLHDDRADVTITDPDEQSSQVTLTTGKHPGLLEATQPVSKTGIYRLKSGNQEILAMAGATDAPEFGDMYATKEKMASVASSTGGGIFWLDDYPEGPELKRTGNGGAQSGWNWIGLKQNDQYRVTGSLAYPLWPAWLAVIVLVGAAMFTWRREGQS